MASSWQGSMPPNRLAQPLRPPPSPPMEGPRPPCSVPELVQARRLTTRILLFEPPGGRGLAGADPADAAASGAGHLRCMAGGWPRQAGLRCGATACTPHRITMGGARLQAMMPPGGECQSPGRMLRVQHVLALGDPLRTRNVSHALCGSLFCHACATSQKRARPRREAVFVRSQTGA